MDILIGIVLTLAALLIFVTGVQYILESIAAFRAASPGARGFGALLLGFVVLGLLVPVGSAALDRFGWHHVASEVRENCTKTTNSDGSWSRTCDD